MVNTYIRLFVIAFWSLFIFVKMTDKKTTPKKIAAQVVLALSVSGLIAAFYTFLSAFQIVIIFIASCVFNRFTSKTNLNSIVTATAIACAISFGFETALTFLSALVLGIIVGDFHDFMVSVSSACVFLIMPLCVLGLFKIRRFRDGLTFTDNKYINFPGVAIAFFVCLCYTAIRIMFTVSGIPQNVYLFSFVFAVVVGMVCIIIWWRISITTEYKEYLRLQEITARDEIIAKKDARIEELEINNEYLSRIIHKDNKMLPSLKHALEELCRDYSPEKAAVISEEIQRSWGERSGILYEYKKQTKKLPSSKVPSLDIMLNYMLQKAYDNNIDFDVVFNGNIQYMTENIIEEELLRTITADLLENAIIAAKDCDVRKILFTIGLDLKSEFHELKVEDSGVDFKAETLRLLGKERTTTHKDEGGSGIGMMEVFSAMDKTGASLIIEKLNDDGNGYTKRVVLRFDGKREYTTTGYEDLLLTGV